MADLSYSDVQRAVGEGTNQLRNSFDSLRSQIGQMPRENEEVQRMRGQMEEFARRMARLEQLAQQNQQYLQQIQVLIGACQRDTQMTIIVAQQMAELRTRFQAVEKFALDMSKYMQRQRLKDVDDDGYNRISG